MVIIVGNNSDPDKNVFSPFQKVNFYIYQNSTSLPYSTFSTTSQTLNLLPTTTENITNNEKSYVGYKIQTWKIILISISCFILILIIIIIILISRKRRFFKKNLKESNFVEIIYQKPEIKEMENDFLQKPNQF